MCHCYTFQLTYRWLSRQLDQELCSGRVCARSRQEEKSPSLRDVSGKHSFLVVLVILVVLVVLAVLAVVILVIFVIFVILVVLVSLVVRVLLVLVLGVIRSLCFF